MATQLHPVAVPDRAFAQWGIDLFGPMPVKEEAAADAAVNRYVCVIVDYLTKWPMAYAIPNKSAAAVFRVLKKAIADHGFPETIISDQVNEIQVHCLYKFTSNIFAKFSNFRFYF